MARRVMGHARLGPALKRPDERPIAAMLASGVLSNAANETITRAQGTPAQAAVAIYFEVGITLGVDRQ
jgi:hypothetical protein